MRIHRILKSSFAGILNQITVILFSFISRSVIINYLGIEILGINSTFTSIISTLSIAELGFQTAVVYSLYNPMQNKDINRINDILSALKNIYHWVGGFIFVSSIIMCPLLPYILNGIEVTTEIYIFFVLQAMSSVCSYFLSYRRTILYADQKIYVFKYIDTICLVLGNICQITVIVFFKSFILFSLIKIAQVFVSNIWINYVCKKMYPCYFAKKKNLFVLKELFVDVKNIFVSKIASYVYASTDNLVISIVLNTVLVGIYGNYHVIATSIRYIANAILNPLAPLIGNYIAKENDKKKREKLFLLCSDIRFCIALLLVVPLIILMEDFIILWVGDYYLLSRKIVVLLGMDLYIHILHSVSVDYINGMGLFAYDKYVEIVAAILNIILSITLTAKIGIEGVLLGTVISQGFFWIGRSFIVYFIGMRNEKKAYFKYWIKNFVQIILFSMVFISCEYINKGFKFSNFGIISLFQKGILSEGIIIGTIVLSGIVPKCYRRLQEMQNSL